VMIFNGVLSSHEISCLAKNWCEYLVAKLFAFCMKFASCKSAIVNVYAADCR
jgi:hypothetical protein